MNTYYFLRHGKVKIEPDKPVSEWDLSEEGKEIVQGFINKGIFDEIDVIYSSEEKKAITTAELVGKHVGKEVIPLSNFNEIDRSKSGYLEDYNAAVLKAFSYLEQSQNDWEPCIEVLNRVKEGVELLDKQHDGKNILIVSHGIAMTLYFSDLLGKMDYLFSRWRNLRFFCYGIVRDGRVEKDLVFVKRKPSFRGRRRNFRRN